MSGEVLSETEPSCSKETVKPIQRETNWPVVLFYIYLHTSAIYATLLIFTQASFYTTIFSALLMFLGTLSITIGCHRLWAHNTYKAVWPLRLLLVIAHTLCCHGTVYDWVKEHRAHHKLRDTELDKFDYKKGFMFAHLLSHCNNTDSRITREEDKIDMSDIEQDNMVMYQKRLYWIVMPIVGLLLPINAPVEYWGESILVSVFVVGMLRIAVLWHASWLVNSANILWGLDPVDRKSGDTTLVFFVNKSLWPQYHYLLPWDYKSGEYGTYGSGVSTAVIRVAAALGAAYDLTTCSSDGIKKALTAASTTGRPVIECLDENRSTSTLTEILDFKLHSA
ncbi:acyl-CoA Delta12-desaturase-like [Macrosteles quadrilineatus]|uniref:acyl-CoA Delta12-desaturase-like n=1 Tax=Macrosteles quadrilineatus TaxID=74068 RepID=UPI0023E2344E|nr:acyl-CoA Delta12-desaturase-like [Macrosteles quadrilineatus]